MSVFLRGLFLTSSGIAASSAASVFFVNETARGVYIVRHACAGKRGRRERARWDGESTGRGATRLHVHERAASRSQLDANTELPWSETANRSRRGAGMSRPIASDRLIFGRANGGKGCAAFHHAATGRQQNRLKAFDATYVQLPVILNPSQHLSDTSDHRKESSRSSRFRGDWWW